MYVAGIMSGSSVDSVDAICADITENSKNLNIKLIAKVKSAFPCNLKSRIELAMEEEILAKEFALLGNDIGILFAKTIIKLQKKIGKKIKLVGSHGQTIWHSPSTGITLQIGNPAIIGAMTKAVIWSDFRSNDVALKGEGAPLAPIAHLTLFKDRIKNSAVVNLGGISNITFIQKNATKIQNLIAFDTGVGMRLLDIVANELKIGPFDKNGDNAKIGKVDPKLLSRLLDEKFLKKDFPKSTGRELFNKDYLRKKIGSRIKFNNSILRTLTEFTALTISLAIKQLEASGYKIGKLILTGGGANNNFLIERIAANLPYDEIDILKSSDLGWPVETVEPLLMALMAYFAENNQKLNLSSITGAKDESIIHGMRTALY
ncbi:MAG: anhydro-N-acetylmuramic acid kinase [Nitrospinota bacterium]